VTGRDDARTHPTVDELADLREGLLSQADESHVREHVDGCAACAAEIAAVDEVAALLRDAGDEPIAMPTAVARAIDDALDQAAATPSARPLPERVATVPARSRLRWVRPAFGWLAGAAAAVVVIGGIGVGVGNLGSDSDNSASGGSGAADSMDGESAAGQPTPSYQTGRNHDKNGQPLARIDEQTIRSYALDLAAARPVTPSSTGNDVAGSGGDSFARRCAAPRSTRGLRQPVIWYGDDALLVVRREARVASVYSCGATPRLLYSAPY
jgi:hypothetical protein